MPPKVNGCPGSQLKDFLRCARAMRIKKPRISEAAFPSFSQRSSFSVGMIVLIYLSAAGKQQRSDVCEQKSVRPWSHESGTLNIIFLFKVLYCLTS